MARDNFSHKVKCITCKTEGVIFMSEDTFGMPGINLTIEKVEGKFTAKVKQKNVEVKCQGCSNTFEF